MQEKLLTCHQSTEQPCVKNRFTHQVLNPPKKHSEVLRKRELGSGYKSLPGAQQRQHTGDSGHFTKCLYPNREKVL